MKIIAEGFEPRSKDSLLAKFKRLAETNETLRLSRKMVREGPIEEYANTPILKALRELPPTDGRISIAYVPPGMGKSTAAIGALSKYNFRGMAICGLCPQDCACAMLTFFELDVHNPPPGWISLLLEALKSPDGDERRPVLILDEFMCKTEYDANAHFICTLRAHVKNTGVHVVVMTSDANCAKILCEMDHLAGIIRPMDLVYSDPDSFPHGRWINMSWTIDQLKVGCKNNPTLRYWASKDEIGQKFDELVVRDTEASLEGHPLAHVISRLEPLLRRTRATSRT